MNPRDLGGEGSRARQSFETSTTYNSLRTSRTPTREQPRGQRIGPVRSATAFMISPMKRRLVVALPFDPELISRAVPESDTLQISTGVQK